MPGDFDKLFGDDWKPQDSETEGGAASLQGSNSGGFNAFDSLSSLFSGDFTSESENRAPRALNEKEVKVMGVYMHQEQGMHPQHFVMLRDNRGRRVPIWIGQFEAWAIMLALEGDAPDRPMTHDLMKLMLERLEVTIERVVIDDLWNDWSGNGTFYAKIGLVKPGIEPIDLDARPSDAIALAIRCRAPIYIAESVLEAAVRPE